MMPDSTSSRCSAIPRSRTVNDAIRRACTPRRVPAKSTTFTGIDSPYQRPKNPDLRLTPERSTEELAELVIEMLESRL